MTIGELQKTFMDDASILGDYSLLTKTELANGYCDADESNDISLKSAYFSALMLRYWYKIFEWKTTSKSLKLEDDEFVSWLSDSLYDVFYYRSWRYEYQAVVRHGKFIEWKLDKNGDKILNEHYWKVDPNAPDKSINYFTAAKRGKVYQYYNKEKRKSNVLSYSLDEQLEENGDSAILNYGMHENNQVLGPSDDLVNYFLKGNKIVEALIIDAIVNYDSFKTVKSTKKVKMIDDDTNEEYEQEYERDTSVFEPRKVIKHLNSINEEFVRNFYLKNSLSISEVDKAYNLLKSLNNNKLYKYLSKTLCEIKQTPSLIGVLER